MKIAPHIIGGIEKMDKASIKYLKYKLDGLIDIYKESDEVLIVVSDINLSRFYDRKITYLGSSDIIIDEIKKMYKRIRFRPYAVSFDFIVPRINIIDKKVN